ncbi:hypothetical protein CN479_23125 [Bacillus thuringiensis]|uniref:hypothetical protein n=1 Tax=Bacillus cereus group TaxID=86661 RepID=UPI000BF8B418|nr:hypothetical protein [Bacillus thuringiensis]MCC2495648.1 hypothetical protein [Bacillus cereus]PER37262.1 hypothetical protein CN479_23125 [Bacillus thuringiensis]HDR4556458.1 hypothetical protein [Bacillus cereus]
MDFIPNKQEQAFLQEINNILHREFALIRLTSTMLKKSIIDASAPIRELLKSYDLVHYNQIIPEEDKILLTAKILHSKIT